MNGINLNGVVNIMTKTWSRDSHGLYDYESTQTKAGSTIINENSVILRKKNEIRSAPTMEEIKDEEYLMDVYNEKNDKFYLCNKVPISMAPTEKNINELQNKIWYVIKHDDNSNSTSNVIINTNEDYSICMNDIIKLGRVKYAANEINIKKFGDMDIDTSIDNSTGAYNIDLVNKGTLPVFDFIYKTTTPPTTSIKEEITCKICFVGQYDEENPLVDLCKCTGGIKYTHYICLKYWMQTKLSKKENEKKTVTSYNIKSFNCEICKTPFPCKVFF
jgi:hypothetical protein